MSIALALLIAAPMQQPLAIFVLSHDVAPGELLSEEAFRPRAGSDRGSPFGALTPAQASGLEATHRLPAGMVVRRFDLRARRAVQRGDKVTISFRSSALSISTPGQALGDATVGQTVRVLAAATHHTLEGVAESPGHVRIQ